MIDNNAMNNSIRPERDLSGVFFIFLDSLPSIFFQILREKARISQNYLNFISEIQDLLDDFDRMDLRCFALY